MNRFDKLCVLLLVVYLLMSAGLNVMMVGRIGEADGLYRVEAKRLSDDIAETGSYDLSQYPHLIGVYTEADGDIYDSDEHYLISEIEGKLYRIEYDSTMNVNSLVMVDVVLAVVLLMLVILFIYFRRHIIKPFGRLNDVPRELAKGNLAIEIPEEKSRYFGRFTWGVNLLREKIENDRRKELALQRDKKLLLLSLSHDIKTPLSAIKLNAKALAKGLYKDEEKRREAAESINARADEIENFVSQITKASSEDFMQFEVVQGEEFLGKIIAHISEKYAPQLSLTGTEFAVGEFSECLLSCDPDRLVECLQNLMENAIKYGDGRYIGISFDRMDGCELITVSNTGCTLEEKELPHIFESFHRGSNAEKAQGSGLGLFICRKLMTLMGGEAYAEIRDGRFELTLVVRMA